MIYSDSRYAIGQVTKSFDSRSNSYEIGVSRVWPTESSTFYIYEWKEGDRLDSLAYRSTGRIDYWWKILDVNPEIIDGNNIAPGTMVRLPRV
jgi:phage tail protein X